MLYPEVSSSTLVQQVTKHVLCEKCRCRFDYQMTRRAHGLAADGSSSGQKAARERAQRKLDKIAAREEDPVACPECGHFQQAMIRTVRRHHLGWLQKAAIVLIPIMPVTGLVILLAAGSETSPAAKMLSSIAIWLMPAGLVLAPTIWLIRWLLARRIDLNAPGSGASRWTGGAPRPNQSDQEPDSATLPEGKEAGRGTSRLPCAPETRQWVRVQPLTWTPPSAQCCGCLRPNERTQAVHITTACSVTINLCAACRRRMWTRRLMISAIVSVVLMVLVAQPEVNYFVRHCESRHTCLDGLRCMPRNGPRSLSPLSRARQHGGDTLPQCCVYERYPDDVGRMNRTQLISRCS